MAAFTNFLSLYRSSRLVGLLLGFGGGVLFCTTFLHMLPEVTENVNKLIEEGYLPSDKFPYAEIFACAGYVCILSNINFWEILL